MQGSAYFQFVSIQCCDKVKVCWVCTLYWGPFAPLQTGILQPCASPSPSSGQLHRGYVYSRFPLFCCSFVLWSICTLIYLSIGPFAHFPFVHLFIGPFLHMCICQLFHWSILEWDDYSDIWIYLDIHLWFIYTEKCIGTFICPIFMIVNIF